MRLKDIILEGRDAVLWHGFKEPSYALTALHNNAMLGTSTQRWWPDDRHHRDDEGDVYEQSYWMKGVSLTRDRHYAQQWGSVVFCLDQRKLSQNYRIVPFSWAKTFGTKDGWMPHYKREREEFVILERDPETYVDNKGRRNTKAFMAPAKRKLEPLTRYLVGIWVDEAGLLSDADRQEIESHPLFKGTYQSQRRRLAAA